MEPARKLKRSEIRGEISQNPSGISSGKQISTRPWQWPKGDCCGGSLGSIRRNNLANRPQGHRARPRARGDRARRVYIVCWECCNRQSVKSGTSCKCCGSTSTKIGVRQVLVALLLVLRVVLLLLLLVVQERQASHFHPRGLAVPCQERHAAEPSNEEQEQLFLFRELLPGAVRERLQREVSGTRVESVWLL